MQEVFCEWWNKELKDVFEHEQERCYEEAGLECAKCEYLKVKKEE